MARFFPQHEIIEMIGYGGMGAVYKARQITLDRVAAMKLLPLEVSADATYSARFRREAEAMARLNHPNVVNIYDFGQTPGGYLYIAMEYVDGAMLHDFIHAGNLTLDQHLEIFMQVCDGLAYAHSKGVVHRDVKPGNVLVDRKLRAKVCDFGLAREIDRRSSLGGGAPSVSGLVLGTPDYMSPEQKRGEKVDQRADIYSLGVLLYEMLCKETPQGAFELPSRRVGTDPRLDHIINRAMQPQQDKRFRSALEMKAAVENAQQPLVSVTARPAAKATPAAYVQQAVRAQSPNLPAPNQKPAIKAPAEESDDFSFLWPGVIGALVLTAVVVFFYQKSSSKKSGMPAPVAKSVAATPRPVAPKPPTQRPAEPRRPKAPPVAAAPGEGVDLLSRTRPEQDAVFGSWRRTPDGLSAEPGEGGRIALVLPYEPPAQYDFVVEFTVPEDAQAMQFFPVPGGMASWKLNSQWDEGDFDGLDLLDGKHLHLRGEASVKRARPLEGGRHVSEIRVRERRIVALLDGKEVLDWQGDFQRLSLGGSFSFASSKKIAVGGWEKGLVFHRVSIRELEGKGSLTRTLEEAHLADAAPISTPATPAPMPSPATPAPTPMPQSEVAKWLEGVEAQFREQHRKDVLAPFDAAVAALREQYLASLDASVSSLSRANRLDEAVAFRDERARVAAGQQPHELPIDATAPLALRQLRENWRKAFAKHDSDRHARAKALHAFSDAALERNQTALTQRQRLDDALLLKAKRDELAAAWLKPPIDLGTATAAPIVQPPPGTPPPSGMLKGREAIELLLGRGIEVTIEQDGQKSVVTSAFSLPAAKYEIVELRSGAGSEGKEVTEEDLAKLAPMKSLKALDLSGSALTGSNLGFAWGAELTEVSLTSPALTGAVFDHLLPQKKLRRLVLLGGKELALTRLGELSAWSTLSELSLSTEAPFASASALAKARSLMTLRIERSTLAEEHFAAIGGLASLERLALDGCSGIGPGWLKPLEKGTKLNTVTLVDSPLAPADLASLGKIRTLQTLEIEAEDAAGMAGATMPNLRAIHFVGSKVGGDTGLAAISGACARLDTLHVNDVAHAFTDAGFESLAGMPRLAKVRWDQAGVTVAQAGILAKLSGLESLTVNASGMTEDHLLALAPSRISELVPVGLRINRACVEALRGMRSLRHLDLRQTTGFTASEFDALKRALPRCRIER